MYSVQIDYINSNGYYEYWYAVVMWSTYSILLPLLLVLEPLKNYLILSRNLDNLEFFNLKFDLETRYIIDDIQRLDFYCSFKWVGRNVNVIFLITDLEENN